MAETVRYPRLGWTVDPALARTLAEALAPGAPEVTIPLDQLPNLARAHLAALDRMAEQEAQLGYVVRCLPLDANGCFTLPNGDCVSPGPCLHRPVQDDAPGALPEREAPPAGHGAVPRSVYDVRARLHGATVLRVTGDERLPVLHLEWPVLEPAPSRVTVMRVAAVAAAELAKIEREGFGNG